MEQPAWNLTDVSKSLTSPSTPHFCLTLRERHGPSPLATPRVSSTFGRLPHPFRTRWPADKPRIITRVMIIAIINRTTYAYTYIYIYLLYEYRMAFTSSCTSLQGLALGCPGPPCSDQESTRPRKACRRRFDKATTYGQKGSKRSQITRFQVPREALR